MAPLRPLIVAALLLSTALPALAQDQPIDPTTTPSDAYLRFAHLSRDAGEQQVTLNGVIVLDGLAYSRLTDWLPLAPGVYEIALVDTTPADDLLAITPISVALVEGDWLTVALIGDRFRDNLLLHPIPDDFDNLAPGETRLTVLHAMPDAQPINVFVNDNLLIGELGYPHTLGDNDGASSVDVAASLYEVRITLAYQPEVTVLRLPATRYQPERHYFIAAFGTLTAPDTLTSSTSPREAIMQLTPLNLVTPQPTSPPPQPTADAAPVESTPTNLTPTAETPTPTDAPPTLDGTPTQPSATSTATPGATPSDAGTATPGLPLATPTAPPS